jgi:iron complex outermembrane receptor protein
MKQGVALPAAIAAGIAFTSAACADEIFEEIVVTVQKREQSTRDVPVSVSAFTGDFLQKLNVNDFRGVVALTPGFNGRTADSFNDALAIRGISSNSFGVGGDPSVPVFVDGIYEGRNGGAVTTFLDMERTEVVRGPQNTLFGRNAIAGAVAMTTNRPNPDGLGGNLFAEIAEEEAYEVQGTVNVPLADRWAFRGSFGYRTRDGYLDNIAGGNDLGEEESTAVQAAIGYEPDNGSVVFTAFYEDRSSDGSAYWSTAPLNSSLELDFTPSSTPLAGGGRPLPDDRVANDLDGDDDADILRLTLHADWELNNGYTLTSITGYKTFDFEYREDYDGTGVVVDHYFSDQDVDYFSQELRLLSPTDGPLTWFVGASVYAEDIDADFEDRYTEDDLCRALQVTEAPDFDLSARVTGCDDPVFEDYWEEDIDPADLLSNKPESTFTEGDYWGWAIYADITWQATERLDLILGLRYTYDEKEYEVCVPDSGGALGNNFIYDFFFTAESTADCSRRFNGASPGGSMKEDDDWDAFTPRIAANFDINEEWTLYGNVAWGFKAGGFGDFGFTGADGLPAESDEDTGLALPGTVPSTYDEEESISFEFGTKTLLFDRTLQANLAFYYYTYDDLQLTFFSGGAQLTDNVAEASGYGAELELSWAPSDRWDIYFTLAYSDTEVEDVDTGFLALGGCDNCEGNELPFAPEWTTSSVITHHFPLSRGAEIFVTGQHSFTDTMYAGLDNIALSETDSWHMVNLLLGYDSGQSWSATLFVNNLFDEDWFERGWENADRFNEFGYGIVNTQVWPSEGRVFGARATYRFGEVD